MLPSIRHVGFFYHRYPLVCCLPGKAVEWALWNGNPAMQLLQPKIGDSAGEYQLVLGIPNKTNSMKKRRNSETEGELHYVQVQCLCKSHATGTHQLGHTLRSLGFSIYGDRLTAGLASRLRMSRSYMLRPKGSPKFPGSFQGSSFLGTITTPRNHPTV